MLTTDALNTDEDDLPTCGDTAGGSWCRCELAPDHDGPHRCECCGDQWPDDYDDYDED